MKFRTVIPLLKNSDRPFLLPRVRQSPVEASQHFTCVTIRQPLSSSISLWKNSLSLFSKSPPRFSVRSSSSSFHSSSSAPAPAPARVDALFQVPRLTRDLKVKKEVQNKFKRRLSNVDNEERLKLRESLLRKQIPAVEEIMRGQGAFPEDSISHQCLDHLIENRLQEIPEKSMAIIMCYCAERGVEFLDVARRLLPHMKTSEGKMHFAYELSYLNVLGNCVKEKPELEGELVDLFDEFLVNNQDALSLTEVCKELIHVISKTSHWMKGFQLFAKLKAENDVKWHDYLPLISAAAEAGNLDVVMLLQRDFHKRLPRRYNEQAANLRYLEYTEDLKLDKSEFIWTSVLQAINEMQDNNDPRARGNIEKLLGHWRATGYIPHIDVAKELTAWFLKFYQDAKVVRGNVKMPKDGVCPITSKRLERLQLFNFDMLQKQFVDEILIGGNIYINSDPEDWASLKSFVKMHAPFDIVIDGLNVSYYDNHHDASPQAMIRQVTQVSKYLSKQLGKKVAVIARKYWNIKRFSSAMQELRKHALVFTANVLSKDDLFVLYCCFQSGPECYILTNDHFREFRKNWSNQLRPAFLQWQLTRQIHVSFDENSRKLALITPRQYNTIVQEVEGTIFIPHHCLTEDEVNDTYIDQDLHHATSLFASLHIPDTFLIVNPKCQTLSDDDDDDDDDVNDDASFFLNHPLPKLKHS